MFDNVQCSVSEKCGCPTEFLTCCWLLSERQFEGVESSAQLVGNNKIHPTPGDLLGHVIDDKLGCEHAITGPLLEDLRLEVLVERLAALQQFQVVTKLPENLCRTGMGAETHEDLLGLSSLEVVEGLGVVSSHGLELDIQHQTGRVLLLADVVLTEATVRHDTDQFLAVVTRLCLVVELLDLPHAAVLVDLLREVHHLALVGILAQHPAELDGRPGSVGDAGDLEHENVT